ETASAWRTKPCLLTLAGLPVDISRAWLQWLAIRFEEQFQFLVMARRWIQIKGVTRSYVAGTMLSGREKTWQLNLPSTPGTVLPGVGWLDRLWQWARAFSVGLRESARLSR